MAKHFINELDEFELRELRGIVADMAASNSPSAECTAYIGRVEEAIAGSEEVLLLEQLRELAGQGAGEAEQHGEAGEELYCEFLHLQEVVDLHLPEDEQMGS